MANCQIKLSKHLSNSLYLTYHFFQECLCCFITSTFAFLDYSVEKAGHGVLFINEIHKVGALLPVCLWWSSLIQKTAYEKIASCLRGWECWEVLTACGKPGLRSAFDWRWRTGICMQLHVSWDFGNHYECLWMVGFCFTLKKIQTTVWSRDWNVTLPDVGIVLLVHQPFNCSQDEFTEQLQHWNLSPWEEQTQTLNKRIYYKLGGI